MFDNRATSRPQAGQLCLMHTTAGFIPGGIVSTKALSTTAAKVHLYRALLQSPTDCSFFELVERNELLLPPINISRTDFKRDGYMRTFKAPTNQRDSVPSPIPFDRYYYQKLAYACDVWGLLGHGVQEVFGHDV
ncbi:hypothetical protein [Corynebacterium glaucum]|uniref:hypothetical protein n=1 Tax=Corynebacterium glaucum TaxID=187491 RepID=UPI0025B3BD1E|nr:hypothetical protein [Corynebacterium glaucum]